MLTLLHNTQEIFSRPGQSQGLLYKHLCNSFIHSFSNPFPSTALWCRHAQMVRDSTSSYRLCDSDRALSKSRRALKSHQWFKSCGHFTEGVDIAYWWSGIGKGLLLQPSQQACFHPNLDSDYLYRRWFSPSIWI